MKLRFLSCIPYFFVVLVIIILILVAKSVSKFCIESSDSRPRLILLSIILSNILMLFLGFMMHTILQRNSIVGSELDKFSYNFQNLKENYYKEIDDKDLLNKAFDTVLKELNDPYTEMITESFVDTLDGETHKLPITFYYDANNDLFIESVDKELTSNIQEKDKVLSVNGVSMIRKRTRRYSFTY